MISQGALDPDRTSSTHTASEDGRVVKASDSKSDGVTRAGSNPVPRDLFAVLVQILCKTKPKPYARPLHAHRGVPLWSRVALARTLGLQFHCTIERETVEKFSDKSSDCRVEEICILVQAGTFEYFERQPDDEVYDATCEQSWIPAKLTSMFDICWCTEAVRA